MPKLETRRSILGLVAIAIAAARLLAGCADGGKLVTSGGIGASSTALFAASEWAR